MRFFIIVFEYIEVIVYKALAPSLFRPHSEESFPMGLSNNFSGWPFLFDKFSLLRRSRLDYYSFSNSSKLVQ